MRSLNTFDPAHTYRVAASNACRTGAHTHTQTEEWHHSSTVNTRNGWIMTSTAYNLRWPQPWMSFPRKRADAVMTFIIVVHLHTAWMCDQLDKLCLYSSFFTLFSKELSERSYSFVDSCCYASKTDRNLGFRISVRYVAYVQCIRLIDLIYFRFGFWIPQ